MPNCMIADLAALPAVICPCGFAKRAFATPDNQTATLHLVDIQEDSRTHYHKGMTEMYLVLKAKARWSLMANYSRSNP